MDQMLQHEAAASFYGKFATNNPKRQAAANSGAVWNQVSKVDFDQWTKIRPWPCGMPGGGGGKKEIEIDLETTDSTATPPCTIFFGTDELWKGNTHDRFTKGKCSDVVTAVIKHEEKHQQDDRKQAKAMNKSLQGDPPQYAQSEFDANSLHAQILRQEIRKFIDSTPKWLRVGPDRGTEERSEVHSQREADAGHARPGRQDPLAPPAVSDPVILLLPALLSVLAVGRFDDPPLRDQPEPFDPQAVITEFGKSCTPPSKGPRCAVLRRQMEAVYLSDLLERRAAGEKLEPALYRAALNAQNSPAGRPRAARTGENPELTAAEIARGIEDPRLAVRATAVRFAERSIAAPVDNRQDRGRSPDGEAWLRGARDPDPTPADLGAAVYPGSKLRDFAHRPPPLVLHHHRSSGEGGRFLHQGREEGRDCRRAPESRRREARHGGVDGCGTEKIRRR